MLLENNAPSSMPIPTLAPGRGRRAPGWGRASIWAVIRPSVILTAVAVLSVAVPATAEPQTPPQDEGQPATIAADEGDEGDARYPDYVIGGIASLAGGAAFVAGGLVAAFAEHPKTALGLTALGTVGLGVGVPLVLIGGADRQPEDSALVGTGTALATPGTIGLGLGVTILAERVAAEEDPELVLPLTLIGVGAAVTVTGLVVWGSGAGRADEPRPTAQLRVGPGSAAVAGTF